MIFQSAPHFHKTASRVTHTRLQWGNSESFVAYLVKQDSTRAELFIRAAEGVHFILQESIWEEAGCGRFL